MEACFKQDIHYISSLLFQILHIWSTRIELKHNLFSHFSLHILSSIWTFWWPSKSSKNSNYKFLKTHGFSSSEYNCAHHKTLKIITVIPKSIVVIFTQQTSNVCQINKNMINIQVILKTAFNFILLSSLWSTNARYLGEPSKQLKSLDRWLF